MELKDLIEKFIEECVKDINSANFDANTYYNLMEVLNGNNAINIDGERYKFIKDFKLNEEDSPLNYKLEDGDIAEILEKMYKNLDDERKEEFLNEMLTHTNKIPYKATEFFNKIAEEKKKEEEENNKPDSSSENNNSEDSDKKEDTPDDSSSPDNEEPETKEEDKDKDLSFDEDGPAITAYKKELEELNKKLKEMESASNKTDINLKEMQSDILDSIKRKRRIEELTKELEEITKKYNEAMRNGFNMSFKPGENAEDYKKLLDEKKKELDAVNNTPDKLDNIKKTISESNLSEEEKKQLNEDLDKYVNLVTEKENVNEEKSKLENERKELEEKYNKAMRNGFNMSFKPGENAEDYKKLLDENKKKLDELGVKVSDIDSNIKNIEDNFSKLNPKNEELEKLKNDIKTHEDNIKLYYEILEEIKKLKSEIDKGLKPDSDEVKNKIQEIDRNKMTLPDPLQNELSKYLKLALGKKPIPIDNINKNPKKTWKTFVALAAGLGIGGVLGFTLGPVGIAVTNLALMGAKALVGHLQREARDRRINGNKVQAIEEPSGKLRNAVHNLKEKILQHEDVLRDINWGLTGGLIGLNVGALANNLMNKPNIPSNNPTPNQNLQPTPNQNPQLTPNQTTNPTPTPDPSPYNDIRIGNKVGDYNVSVGHDTANWAVNGTHTENLLSQYVNGDSVFKQFAVLNPDGSVAQIITNNGTSINDLIANGIDPNRIGVSVGKNGIDQAWTSISELIQGTGRSLH